MVNLTWRDVAAPTFASASDGFSQFSKLFGDGLTGLKSAVGGFDQAKSDMVNKQFLLASAQMPDAVAAQKAVLGGNFGGMDIAANLGRLSEANIRSLGPEAMTARGAAELRLADGRIDSSQEAAQDAQAPQIAQMLANLNSPDPAVRAKAIQDRAMLDFTGTGAKFAGAINDDFQSTQSTATGIRAGAFTQDNAETDRNDETVATAVRSEIRAGALSADDARLLLYERQGLMSPRAFAKLESQLAGDYPGLFGTGASGAIAGAVGGGGAPALEGGGTIGTGAGAKGYNAVFGYGKFAQPDKDPTSMTLAEVQAFQKDKLIPATRGKIGRNDDQGTGAIGAYQFTHGTLQKLAKAEFGDKWQSMQFTPEVQEKLAERLWNEVRGGNIHDTWEGMPNNAPGAYKNVAWKDVRGKITGVESGVGPADLIRQATDANVGVALRGIQDSDGLDFDLVKTVSDTSNVAQVTDRLIGPGGKDGVAGPLRGTSRAFVLDKVNQVMRDANVNAATAAAMIERSIVGSDQGGPLGRIFSPRRLVRQLTPGSTPNLANGARIDDRALKERVARLKTTDIRKEVAASMSRSETTGQVQAASSAVAQAQANLVTARKRAITAPKLAPMVARYEAELAAAMMQLQSVKNAANGPAFQPSSGE